MMPFLEPLPQFVVVQTDAEDDHPFVMGPFVDKAAAFKFASDIAEELVTSDEDLRPLLDTDGETELWIEDGTLWRVVELLPIVKPEMP